MTTDPDPGPDDADEGVEPGTDPDPDVDEAVEPGTDPDPDVDEAGGGTDPGDEAERSPASDGRPSVSAVVPAHDEEANLRECVDALRDALGGDPATEDFEIVLVDDNSTDGTPELCDELAAAHPEVRVVHRTTDPGFGNAVKAGLAAARGEAVVPVMADLSDDPTAIPRMRRTLDEGYDVVYGSRFVPGGSTHGYPRGKMIANRVFNNTARLLFGLKHRDVSNAFKMYRREVLDELDVDDLESTGFSLTVELPLKAHIQGFRSTEIPVSWRGREAGQAKFDVGGVGWDYGKRLLTLFVRGNLVGLRDIFESLYEGPKWRLGAGLLVGILLVLGLAQLTGGTEVLDHLRNASLPFVAGAAAVSFGALLVRVWRWSVLLRTADHRVRRRSAYRGVMFGWFVNYLLPAKLGDVARGLAIRVVEAVPVGAGLATIAVERAMDMVFLASLLAASVLLIASPGQLVNLAYLAGVLVAVLALVLALVGAYDRSLEDLSPRLHGLVQPARDGLRELADNPAAMILAGLLTVGVWTLEVGTVYLSARALGVVLPAQQAAVVGAAAFVAQAVPTTPAGLGLHEGAIAGVLVVFGVPASTAFAVGVVDHIARAVVVYLFGAAATVHLGFQSRPFFRDRRLEEAA